MNTINAHIKYRPVRIGFCVRENNLEDYRKALRLTHTLWGGRYNPIIPVGFGFDLGSKLVESFKVDVLYPIENDKILIDFVKKFPYLPWPLHSSENLFIKRKKSFEPAFLDIYQAVLRLNSDLIQNNYQDNLQLNFVSWELSDPLSNMFEAIFGAYPPVEEIGIGYNELIASRLNVNNIALNANMEVPSDILKYPTRNQLTTYLLLNREPSSYPGLYAGSINSFSDLINFWNMRACGMSLLFYDSDYASRLEDIKNSYLEEQANRPKHDYRTAGLGVWTTIEKIESLNKKILNKNLERFIIDDLTLNNFNRDTVPPYFKGKTALGVSAGSPNVSLSFQLPEKPIFSDDIGHFQYLITSIHIFKSTMGEEQTFQVPYIPELNTFYGEKIHQWNEVRVEPEGLGFITRLDRNNLYLRSINVKQLTQEIFNQYGIKATPSKAGLIASRIIQQFSGLDECRIFKIKGVRELIEKYSPSQSFTRQNAEQIIGQNHPITCKPNFLKYENLYITNRPVGSKLTASQVFTYLLKNEVFRAGLKLKCPNCDLLFWQVIDDIKSKCICEFCGKEFNILDQLKNRDWFYRRSGIFGQDDNQEGGISTVLTLQQLYENFYSDNFIYTTAMNIESDGADVNKCETDFVIITWNRFGEVEIVISECKTRQAIEQRDSENLKKIADAISKNRIEVFILFSKLEDFSDAEISICMQAQNHTSNRVIMLTHRELESVNIYEQAKADYLINEYATNWKDMALNTIKIFSEKNDR